MALEITHLVLGLTEAQVLDVLLQKEFSERQELGLFREKHTPQSVGHLRRKSSLEICYVSFYGMGNFIG